MSMGRTRVHLNPHDGLYTQHDFLLATRCLMLVTGYAELFQSL